MGGIAIVGGVILGYVIAHVRTEQLKFARTGLTLMFLVVGLAIVGFLDDYLAVRRGRNLGLRKRGKTGGQLLVASGFALLALQWVDVSTNLSFTRALDLDLGMWLWFALAKLTSQISARLTPRMRAGMGLVETFMDPFFSVIPSVPRNLLQQRIPRYARDDQLCT